MGSPRLLFKLLWPASVGIVGRPSLEVRPAVNKCNSCWVGLCDTLVRPPAPVRSRGMDGEAVRCRGCSDLRGRDAIIKASLGETPSRCFLTPALGGAQSLSCPVPPTPTCLGYPFLLFLSLQSSRRGHPSWWCPHYAFLPELLWVIGLIPNT